MPSPLSLSRCDVCGTFSVGDECCGKEKPYEFSAWFGELPHEPEEPVFAAAWGGIPLGASAVAPAGAVRVQQVDPDTVAADKAAWDARFGRGARVAAAAPLPRVRRGK